MLLTGSRPLVVALLVTAGCSSGGHGARDAGHDAGRDTGVDAARPDTGPRDAGTDAGGDGGPEGWTPLPGLPDWCVVERAAHPSAVLTPVWEPCSDGSDGCQRLRLPGPWGWSFGGVGTEPGVFAFDRRSGDRSTTLGLADTSRGTLAAWRYRGFVGSNVCMVGLVAAGQATGAFACLFDGHGEVGANIYVAALTDLFRDDSPAGQISADDFRGSNGPQAPQVSGSTFVAEMQPGGYVLVVERGAIARLGGIHSLVPGIPQSLQLVGRHVLWQSWEDNIDVAHGSFDEPASYFMREPGVDFLSFGTDGTDMAWVRCEGGAGEGSSCARIELWAAPYTPDPASIRARRVVALPARITTARVSGGWFHYRDVLADGRDTIELWRLIDGEHRRWTAPAGWEVFDEALWCTPDEVATGARRLAEHDETVVRVQIASLPVVPP